MDGQRMDGWTDDGPTDRHTSGWIDQGMDGQTEGWMDRQTDGWADRLMDGQTDGQNDRQTDRWTE